MKNPVDGVRIEIEKKLEWVSRTYVTTNQARENAEAHGRLLAAAIRDYVEKPEYLGLDYLEKALKVFYGGSATSFRLSPDEVIKLQEDEGVADCLHPLSERRHPTEDNPAEWCWECGLEGRFHSPVRAQSGPHFPGNHDGDYPGAHWPEGVDH